MMRSKSRWLPSALCGVVAIGLLAACGGEKSGGNEDASSLKRVVAMGVTWKYSFDSLEEMTATSDAVVVASVDAETFEPPEVDGGSEQRILWFVVEEWLRGTTPKRFSISDFSFRSNGLLHVTPELPTLLPGDKAVLFLLQGEKGEHPFGVIGPDGLVKLDGGGSLSFPTPEGAEVEHNPSSVRQQLEQLNIDLLRSFVADVQSKVSSGDLRPLPRPDAERRAIEESLAPPIEVGRFEALSDGKEYILRVALSKENRGFCYSFHPIDTPETNQCVELAPTMVASSIAPLWTFAGDLDHRFAIGVVPAHITEIIVTVGKDSNAHLTLPLPGGLSESMRYFVVPLPNEGQVSVEFK